MRHSAPWELRKNKLATVQAEPGFDVRMDGSNSYYLMLPTYRTVTDWYVASIDGDELDLHGSFTYNLDGSLASGVITGVAEYQQGTVLKGYVSGLDVDARALIGHFAYDANLSTIWQGMLGGGDYIVGGNGAANHIYGFGSGGDYIVGGHSHDVLDDRFHESDSMLGVFAADSHFVAS
jgi:hypothetical protein